MVTRPADAIDPGLLDRYLAAARKAGCPRDQVENFIAAGIVLQRKQLQFAAAARTCDYRCPACQSAADAGRPPRPDCPDCGPTQILLGGARGPGKTFGAVAQVFADDCARYPGLKFLYLRLAANSAEEAVRDLRKTALRHIPHEFKVKDSLLIRSDNGSSIKLRHFQNERDIEGFQGIEYDGMLIEEATQLTGGKINDAMSSMRTSKPNWRPRAYLTANPGGIGHTFIKRRFVIPFREGTETFTRFIPATVEDNRFVDPESRLSLERHTGIRLATWRYGDWDAIAGQFFEHWRHDLHVQEPEVRSPAWSYWLGFDFGFNHATSVHLFAKDLDGTRWALDEHWARKTQVADHARSIKAMVARHLPAGIGLETIQAGGDVFNKDRNGISTADEYAKHGLRLDRANSDRVAGAAEIVKALGDDHNSPTVFISPRCARLIESLPEMVHDRLNVEKYAKADMDENGAGGDDAVDSFRYGMMYRPGPRVSKAKNPFADRQWN